MVEKDVETTEPEEEIEDVEETETEETETTEEPAVQAETSSKPSWVENFSVKEKTDIEEVARLKIVAGVNEYKGQHLVFLAKVTDKDFSRQFFSMPAYVWEKAIPILQKYIPQIAEIEKKSMVANMAKELTRLKELGINIQDVLKAIPK